MLPNKRYTPEDVLQIAKKRLPLVVAPALLGLFIALVVSSRLPNVYQAEMLIQIVPQRVPNSFVQTMVTVQTEDRLDALGQQVTSRTQLERLIRELDLYPAERATRPMQDVVERMRSDIMVDPQRSARHLPVEAFYLRFKYGDPVIAVRVTERLGFLFVDQNARERVDLAKTGRDFLQGRLEEAKKRLEEQDKKLQAFRERNSGRLPTQVDYNMQAIQSTQMQRQAIVESLGRDRDRKLMLERMLNDAANAPVSVPAPPAATPSDPQAVTVGSPRQRLDAAKATLARLELRLTENHPDLRRTRDQIAELEKEVAAATTTGPASATHVSITPEELQRQERLSRDRAEIESLARSIVTKEAEERRLSAVIAGHQAQLASTPGVESEWLPLTRNYETLSVAYKELLTKSESASASVDLETRQVSEQFQVLDAPRVPARPFSPARPLISLSGLAAGLAVGLVLVAGLELKDGSLKTELDVEQVLELPVLALVPKLMTTEDRVRTRRLRKLVGSAVAVSVIGFGYVVWAMKLWQFVA